MLTVGIESGEDNWKILRRTGNRMCMLETFL